MIGLVMAGGRGTRMNILGEKLLLEYKKPLIMHVIDALKDSKCFSKIIAATSDHSPRTNELLMYQGVEVIKTKGEGYVSDLDSIISNLDEPTFVVSGDLPLLDGKTVKELVSKYNDDVWHSFVLTKKFLDLINIKLEYSVTFDDKECYYSGISIVNPKKISGNQIQETLSIFDDERIAVNINTKEDYELLKNS